MNSGGYIGIIIGILVFIVLKTACIVVLWRRKTRRDKSRILSSTGSSTYSVANTAELLTHLEKWEIRCDDVKLIRRPDGSDWELGSGAFGRVVKGIRGGVQEVAVKMLFKSDQKNQEAFLREISMLKFVARDRNVVQFYGVSIQNNGIWLVTELMEGGDLRNALTLEGDDRVTWWNKGKQIACDVAKGLAFLHLNKVIHRDLKSKNVLLTKDGEAKLTDVGMAKLMSEAYYTQDNNIGTFAWAAPEILMGEKCSEKVDCYSLGVTIWEIACQLMPVRGKMETPTKEDCPTDIAVLISELMRRDPRKRPSAAEAYRRLKASEPNPEIVPLPEELHDAPSIVHSTASKSPGITWEDSERDLDSAGDLTTNTDNKLMHLADGASHNVTMMENSFMHLSVPERKKYMAESYNTREADILNSLSKAPEAGSVPPQKEHQLKEDDTLLRLAEDASMQLGTIDVGGVDGGTAKGVTLTTAQREAIERQDGLPGIENVVGGPYEDKHQSIIDSAEKHPHGIRTTELDK